MSALRRALGHFARTPFHPQWLVTRRVLPDALCSATGIVLDIGAGDRWIAQHLPDSARYIALDYPKTGRDLYGARPDVFADATCLPFADASVDTVVSFEVIEHVRYPDAMLAEIARTLKPGGRAYLSMPFLYPVHDAPHDYQRWTRHGWARSAAGVGLEALRIEASSRAIEAAAILGCLAIAGPLQGRPAWRALVAATFAIPMITLINLTGWTLARVWPDWSAMSAGLHIELLKR